ncbi:uncharacterized protein BDR25DRAFT_371888 [Lindgomyces ingoldianus]|uniref:Uncharacterized protein n=1 Tax=Lindgomyces ingoldianus TaxID=673940 RepID=A0ACB6QS55_9PLEO|nr:uncharacterized protein BDR25DRAFT_371888 [Lindgomyces ingoldianus]KAF2469345.1 hypothetical protein BDR25DRAFT_371888 [Lindgomyces ingoldianus]
MPRPKLSSCSLAADVVNLRTERKCELISAFWLYLHLAVLDSIAADYASSSNTLKFATQELDGLLTIVRDLKANRNMAQKKLTNPRDTRIDWQDDLSLDDMFAAQFSHEASKTAPFNFPIDGSFTAINLKKICRLHIRWTDNLIDHLKLEGRPGQRSLSIYRQKIYLINHRREPETTRIQAEILNEAIHTLDLLFPIGDEKTEDFLEEENINFNTRDASELPRATELNDFKYWRNNLGQLLTLLNGPPETVVQTLLDTRNITQFATLWVSIIGIFLLTILFGIITSVYSIKQYRVAIKSYELSLALACQQMNTPLPGFCS